jgi:ubiquinone/menaquinone biosynthesis C-methylase UbiE
MKRTITRYTPLEAYFYDRFVAPVVVEISGDIVADMAKQIPQSLSLLDVGCGGGQLAIELAMLRDDLAITGLDLSAGQIKRARKRASLSVVSVDFVEGDAMNLPFEDAGFDIVFSISSIKHWPDMKAGLAQCIRVLKPGGVLMIAEVDKECPRAVALKLIEKLKYPFFIFIKKRALKFYLETVSGGSIGIGDIKKIAATLKVSKYDTAMMLDGLCWVMMAEK